MRRSRLIAFLRRWPLVVRTSLCSCWRELVELHALDQLAHRLGAHAGAEQARATAHAGAVLAVELAEVEAVERSPPGSISPGWMRLISSRALRTSSLVPSASPLSRSRSASSVASSCRRASSSLRLTASSSLASRCWISCVDALDLCRGRLVERVNGGLVCLVAGADDDLARRLEHDGLLGSALGQRLHRLALAACWASTRSVVRRCAPPRARALKALRPRSARQCRG